MKTAIQELLDELKANDVAHGMYWIEQPDVFFDKYLEKEKEQIIDAVDNTRLIIGDDFDSEYQFTNGNEYYNQTYNQNI